MQIHLIGQGKTVLKVHVDASKKYMYMYNSNFFKLL